MKEKLLLLALGMSSLSPAFGQALLPNDYHSVPNVQSPTVASLGRYGDIPVDLFTGTPQISVPLTSIEYGGIKVPVTLSYNASGIRVAERPGWVGLGWNIIAGGQITRKTNWFVDEWYNRSPNTPAGYSDQGFYFLGNRLNTADWNTYAKVKDYCVIDWDVDETIPSSEKRAKMLGDGDPDEFIFSFGEYSGSFYRSETGQWQVISKQDIKLEVQSEIDYSGNFKLYKDFYNNGQPGVNTNYSENVASLFTKFIIITPDGYKYEFGGSPSAIEFSRAPTAVSQTYTAIERRNNITANAWNLTKITTPQGESIVFNYERGQAIFNTFRYFSLYYNLISTNNPNTQSGSAGDELSFSVSATNPSYLTSIESPARKIEFIRSNATELSSEPTPVNLLHPIVPKEEFKSSIAYNWVDLNYAYNDPDIFVIPNYNQRLDEIKVYDKIRDEYLNKVVMGQTNDASKRRTLSNLTFYDFNGHSAGQYKFTYSNVENLPFYESLRRDHWGYFNGGTEPSGPGWPIRASNGTYSLYGLLNAITYPTGGTTTFQFEPNYYSSAVHIDPNASQPITTTPSQGSAGVRIRAIASQANFSSPVLTTEYFYASNYANGGSSSSGILSSEPRYIDFIKFTNPGGMGNLGASCEGNFELTNQTDDNSEWMSQARGGLVTYSEVTTKNPDGSYTITKFTNNDNAAYRDELGSYYNFGGYTTLQSNYRLTSNDLERGKILSEESFNSTGALVADKIYTYRNDPNRKNQFIKAISKKILLGSQSFNDHCGGYGLGGGMRAWGYKVYYYKNPLKKVESNLYETNGTVTTSKSFTYDDYGNVTKTVETASDGKKMIQDIRYNSDPAFLQYNAVTTNAINIRKLFYQHKIKNMPVETTTTIQPGGNSIPAGSDRITSGTLWMFNKPLTVPDQAYKMELQEPFYPVTYSGFAATYHYTPAAINSNGEFVADERYKLQSTVNTFTTNATASPGILNTTSLLRPLNISTTSGSFAYTWDYGMQYVSSKTQNTPLNNFVSGSPELQTAFTSFEGSYFDLSYGVDDNRGNWNFDKSLIIDGGITGKKYINLYTGASYDQVISTFVLKKYKKYILSFWAKGAFPRLLNGTTPVGPAYLSNNAWKYYEFEITGDNQPMVLKVANQGGSGPQLGYITSLDEVRLYPADAQMQSYTYNAFGNVTSVDDGAGRIIFYEYDFFGRLKTVKDQDGNILKSNGYTIQGAQ